jgi:tRNA (adenine22-N1)-methyltransferase
MLMGMQIKVDKRIRALLSMLNDCNCLADIGCDHGFTCVTAVMEQSAKRAIAADISAPSLNKAKRLVRQKGLDDVFEFRCGDGLCVLNRGEADAVIISGVGGELLAKILSDGESKIDKDCQLILSPNNREHMVRLWLVENGFCMTYETVVFEKGKYYQMIKAKKGKSERYDEIDLELGKINIKNKDETFKNYVAYKQKGVKIIIDKIARDNGDKQALNTFEKKLNAYQEILNGY